MCSTVHIVLKFHKVFPGWPLKTPLLEIAQTDIGLLCVVIHILHVYSSKHTNAHLEREKGERVSRSRLSKLAGRGVSSRSKGGKSWLSLVKLMDDPVKGTLLSLVSDCIIIIIIAMS